MIPIIEELIVITVENFTSYPAFFIIGIITEPIAAVSAVATPEIPPKNILVRTLA